MPMYDYVCPECGHVTEAMSSYADRESQCPCEACGHDAEYQFTGGRMQTYRLKNHGGRPELHNLKEV